ncbi:MAG: DegT/DnrJ/EryC1/StrS family aminotransferase [Bacteroidetes bacterium]|nr:DegT/DnrJ/EryC1/StrS family aminotransferase [Bacteroidota bacterium]
MQVPFFDLKRQYDELREPIHQALDAVMEKTAFSGGPFVDEFEKQLAAYNETAWAVGLNSGTSALHLAMLALGIGAGDEVIIPANTFIATAWGPSYAGATPVFVDCDPHTWNMDPVAAEKAITSKTKAIIGVHLYGQPCDIDALMSICVKHHIHFIEDNAQGIGATYKGKKAGTFGVLSCTSFYPGKNLGCYGEGGALFTNDKAIAEHCKSLRSHGATVRYYHDEVGYNYRMEGFQAAVLQVKLAHIDRWNNRRREIVNRYREEIQNPKITFQKSDEGANSVYHIAVVCVGDRENFTKFLEQNQIGFAFHYPVPCHLQKAYAHLGYKNGDFPNSEYQASHAVSLPLFPEMTDVEVDRVIEVIRKY